MSRKRISMRKIKEVLRLKFEADLTYDAIGRSCNIGHTTVREYIKRAQEAGLRWPIPADMDDNLLENYFIHNHQIKIQSDLCGTGTIFTGSSRRRVSPFFYYGRKSATFIEVSIM
ncbi:MAG: hypothetical protein JW882_15150 [Deltaproteobacteria bacterium]|nr:hypothetical protein [Deltaproteobacteria bacterium]